MTIAKLLIANRGEIAVRIARAASELGLASVAVFARDDARSLHVRVADEAVELELQGAAAYLDIEALVAVAKATGCDAIHPGYGFLSESATFARRAAGEGITFVGPAPEHLELFGDKSKARAAARAAGIPLLAGTSGPTSLDEVKAFFASLGPDAAVMIKAIAGGGGRGMRVVTALDAIDAAYERCRSEAQSAFGSGDLYVERYLPSARHIEVQVVGDGRRVTHLGERECSIQRRNQKIVEVAPSPTLPSALREALCAASVRLAEEVGYRGLGTFEYLVPAGSATPTEFAFMEVNPRLQVEHTVTEEVYGVDLVQTQLKLAAGACLADVGLGERLAPRGFAIELRVNMETIAADGSARPSGGTLEAFDTPAGPGIRVDSFGYAGYTTSPRYDSLLAKLVVHNASPDYGDAVRRAYRALCEFRIQGVATNLPLLRALLKSPAFLANEVHTRFLEQHIGALLADADAGHRELFHRPAAAAAGRPKIRSSRERDPLAVFDGEGGGALAEEPSAAADPIEIDAPEGLVAVAAPLQGTIVGIDVAAGTPVRAGQPVLVLEAMKMEHVVTAEVSGIVRQILVAPGDTVFERSPLVFVDPAEVDGVHAEGAEAEDLDAIRPDLAEAIERHEELYDARRPDAVARRRKTNQRTVRENIADLVDPGSFIEYGALAVAAQRQRRSFDELRRVSPADGMVTGLASVNGDDFADEAARCAVMGYDYTVFAGTQGVMNHRKKDRLLGLAEHWRLPVVVFAEGGGGRPGDEWPAPAGLDTTTFLRFGALSGLVPVVGVTAGRAFAGNAAVLGGCDVIIAAENSNIGMGGPAMIEGGGLGIFRPEDVGPMSVQVPNGVVDIAVADEAEGVKAAKKYLSYFQGRLAAWDCADQRRLRRAIPENRLRAYDIRPLIETLADSGSVQELRPGFGVGMITALIRVEGRPMGLIANNSRHLGGAIDADGGDKAARFIQLCDAFDLPIVSLCDTPGMMVGPEVEKTAQVRHVSRMFIAAANATVPYFTVVLRKGYGLGALAMAGGSSHASFFLVSWPTGEFGPMGLEGGVKLAYRKELLAIDDPAQRKAWFDQMVAQEYEKNKALSSASYLEVDDVIDPSETRRWLVRGLRSLPAPTPRAGKKRVSVDVW
ncbi:carboxyl transferase domain-containing protein [Chelatococcus reniformis]|uniref:Pyruvate carboxylase n=1 Tax=Chelatococcus reniformis TaxID=1494448 RepID=A0A916XCY3_9HYPH|nr:carboxyl transferase domain-containing protein [Chelatococcus reniformis]GGC61471.1 pyruvate carboxylase [Chelatococcus reniformis]